MRTQPSDWLEWDKSEVLPYSGGTSFHIRTATPCTITDYQGLILGLGTGEQEVIVTGQGEITFECETAIWLKPTTRVQERIQQSTEIFTSLDRPAPMSPEMLAIERMMRRNEMQREYDRQEMEQRFAYRLRNDARSKLEPDASDAPAKEKETVRANTPASDDNAAGQNEHRKIKDAPSDRVHEREPTGDEDSASSD